MFMLDHILNTAQNFERAHGMKPDVIYINPLHFECLYKLHYGLFHPDQEMAPGFRLVILPASVPVHATTPRPGGMNRDKRRSRKVVHSGECSEKIGAYAPQGEA
jgi:hypothetical protein